MTRKLAFYSNQEIPENLKLNQRLLTLFERSSPKIGYIPSATDPDGRSYHEHKTYYATLGIDVVVSCELDVHYDPECFAQILTCDGIHLSGGNTYHFLYWMQQRGLMPALRHFVERGGVLIGISAGGLLMTPEISSTAYRDNSPLPGEEMEDLSALHLVDFAFFPHINSFPGHEAQLIDYSLTHPYPIYGCADGDGIIVENEQVEFYGQVKKAEHGILTTI
jgi:dipeptidase E